MVGDAADAGVAVFCVDDSQEGDACVQVGGLAGADRDGWFLGVVG